MRIQALVDTLLDLQAVHGDVEVAINDADTGWTLLLTERPKYDGTYNVIIVGADPDDEIVGWLE